MPLSPLFFQPSQFGWLKFRRPSLLWAFWVVALFVLMSLAGFDRVQLYAQQVSLTPTEAIPARFVLKDLRVSRGLSPSVVLKFSSDTSGLTPTGLTPTMTNLKLIYPFRLIVDIANTGLGNLKQTHWDVNRGGISTVDITENKGVYYQSLRMVVTVEDFDTLRRLVPEVTSQRLLVSLDSQSGSEVLNKTVSKTGAALKQLLHTDTASNSPAPPLPPERLMPEKLAPSSMAPLAVNTNNSLVVISEVSVKDGQLYITARGPKETVLKVKNRFILSDPKRLVIDLDHTVLPSTIKANAAAPFRSVRLAQFDPETVRLVIETETPDRIQLYYPSENRQPLYGQTLCISGLSDSSVATLPVGTQLGVLDNVYLDHEKGATVLRLETSSPLVHRIQKQGNRVVIDMLNIAARPGGLNYDKQEFAQLAGVRVDGLNATQPNSRFVLELKPGDESEMTSQLSANGKLLSVILTPVIRSITGGNGLISKAPFPARVVIDAGHGGKDKGANREGLLEKDLNLTVALKLKRALEARGVRVTMTRSVDMFLELSEITAITNREQPDLFVSVHTNASTNPGIYGLETYYYTPQSRLLAQKVHNKLVNLVGAPDRGVRTAVFYVIHHTQVPAILCEMGYISNTAERAALQSDARQEKTANAIAEGVVEYLKSRVAASAR